MATLYSIVQGCQKLLEGADPASKKKFAIAEIKRYVIQIINSMIKTQHVTETMGLGENIPDGLVLAEYDSITVERYKNVSRAALPAMPVSLHLNKGIFHVGPTDDVINGFIPFQPGEYQMIGEESLISDVLGQIAYWPMGKYVIFNRDITTNDSDTSINEVYMQLVVKDLSLYGDWDLLPISADMEVAVIQKTFEFLAPQFVQNKKVDVIDKQEEVKQ